MKKYQKVSLAVILLLFIVSVFLRVVTVSSDISCDIPINIIASDGSSSASTAKISGSLSNTLWGKLFGTDDIFKGEIHIDDGADNWNSAASVDNEWVHDGNSCYCILRLWNSSGDSINPSLGISGSYFSYDMSSFVIYLQDGGIITSLQPEELPKDESDIHIGTSSVIQ